MGGKLERVQQQDMGIGSDFVCLFVFVCVEQVTGNVCLFLGQEVLVERYPQLRKGVRHLQITINS